MAPFAEAPSSFAFGAIGIAARLFGELHHRFIDFRLRNFADELLDLYCRHFQVDVLGRDLGVCHELVARFQRLSRGRVASDRCF